MVVLVYNLSAGEQGSQGLTGQPVYSPWRVLDQ